MTPRVRLTRVVRFEAAHRLLSAQLSDDQNWSVFGKCSRPGGHGHNYEVEVTLEGPVDPATGMVASRAALDAMLQERLLQRVDHRNLNDVTALVTTGENLARLFFDWVQPAAPTGTRLARVRLLETRRNRFETTGR